MKKTTIILLFLLISSPLFASEGIIDFDTGRMADRAVYTNRLEYSMNNPSNKGMIVGEEVKEEAKNEMFSSIFSLVKELRNEKREWTTWLADKGIVYDKRVGVILGEKKNVLFGANFSHGDTSVNISPNLVPTLRLTIESNEAKVGFKKNW